MDFICIRSFIEVARCHSFTKAAENLGYVQSSVTTHIQKLEQEYGVILFERFGRSMRLTSAGEQLRDTFEQILALYESSKQLISRSAKGHLDIGTIESLFSFFLPPVFHQFRRGYPEINLQVHPITETQILQLIRAGEIDMGVVLDQPIQEEDIEAIKLREEELVLVASPGHSLQHAVQICAADLNGQSYIATEHTCTYRHAFERLLGRHGVEYDVHHEFGSIEAIKQCVSYGLGIGLLPRIAVVRELSEGRLIRLPFSHPDITFYTQIVIHRKKWRDPAIRHLIEFLHEAAGRDDEGAIPRAQ